MFKTIETRLREAIVDYPDFPKPGVLFRDAMPVLLDSELRHDTIEVLCERYYPLGVTAVAGSESRGFLFGVLLADRLEVPFVPVRKPGKLPGDIVRQRYDLEYGSDELQIQQGVLNDRDRVVIVDDLLATGGTAEAASELVEQTGAEVVENAFVIELVDLNGRKKLGERAVYSLVKY
jgi:adenine phosphoribosyltransferase